MNSAYNVKEKSQIMIFLYRHHPLSQIYSNTLSTRQRQTVALENSLLRQQYYFDVDIKCWSNMAYIQSARKGNFHISRECFLRQLTSKITNNT